MALRLCWAFVLDEFLVVPGSLSIAPQGVFPGRWKPFTAVQTLPNTPVISRRVFSMKFCQISFPEMFLVAEIDLKDSKHSQLLIQEVCGAPWKGKENKLSLQVSAVWFSLPAPGAAALLGRAGTEPGRCFRACQGCCRDEEPHPARDRLHLALLAQP